MSTLRHAWASLLSSVPAPWQAGLALVIALLLLTKLAPRLIRGIGRLLQTAWTPFFELLTYPEYLLTSTFRRYGWQPLSGTYAYGRLMGALTAPGTRAGQWLGTRFDRRPRFPWKTTVLIIAVLAACWYAAPKVPPGTARTVLADVNTADVHVKTWLSTGQWTSPVITLSATCRPAAPTRHQPPRKRKTKVRAKQK